MVDRSAHVVGRVRVIGAGRAGGSFAVALRSVGLEVDVVARNGIEEAAAGADLVLICTPDDVIAEVAASIRPADAVVAHCSGSRTLGVLAPHERRCSIHPLMSLPDPDVGARRLLDSCRFAVAGNSIARTIVERLGGIAFDVADEHRAEYHAAATVAANHLVALCAEVEAMAAELRIDPDGFWTMMQTVLANVAAHGAAASLTGPVARGDWATVRGHLDVLDNDQRSSYLALARVAARVAGNELPDDLS